MSLTLFVTNVMAEVILDDNDEEIVAFLERGALGARNLRTTFYDRVQRRHK